MKLNNKTTLIYLLFTAIVLSLSGYIAIKILERDIENMLEHRFTRSEERIIEHIQIGNDMPLPKRMPYLQVKEIETSDTSYRSFTSDTIMTPHTLSENIPFRKKTIYTQINNQVYEISIFFSLKEYSDSRNFIIKILSIIFAGILTLLLIFNFFISKYFWRPFQQILNHMNSYSLNRNIPKIQTNSTTSEFLSLEEYYNDMILKIENDYTKLKEYTENMAHEIQTPLTIIRNKSEKLIGNDDIMKIDSKTVSAIYEETNNLSNLSNTLNLLTKIENREFRNAKKINVKEIVVNHLEKIKEIAALKEIEIITNLDEKLSLDIDPFLMDILFKNLIKNALRYSLPNNNIFIESNADSITFINFGDALKGDEKDLFNRFYKDQKEGKSLGLGLAIVKKICELNKLDIAYHYTNKQHHFVIKKL